MRHNLVLAIMPPHIRGVPFIFLSYPRFRRYRGYTDGLRYAAHMRGLLASPTPKLAYLGLPRACRGLYHNEERPCGRREELTLFVVKNALRLL